MTAIQTLIQAVEAATTPKQLIEAVQALAAQKSAAAIPTLIAVLGYNNPGAALMAVEGLVQLGQTAVEPILESLDAYNYGARAYAIRALAAIADPKALDVLLNAALNDFAPSVRRAASKGLGVLQWQQLPIEERRNTQYQAQETLLQVVRHPDWDIRYAGIFGLQALAQASDPDLRQTLEQTLIQIAQTEPETVVKQRAILACERLQTVV